MYTRHNLGDTAIVNQIMLELRRRIPGCEFIGINRVPREAVGVHGIPALHSSGYGTPLRADGSVWDEVDRPEPRWLSAGLGTRRIFKVVRMLDLLVMSGGGQIEDFFGGTNSQPRALFTWVAVARMLGVPVAFWSVGVDLLTQRSSRFLCANAVRMGHLRSFRDAGSVDLLRGAGMGAECRVDPDPALSLDTSAFNTVDWRESDLIVLSPISYRTWTEAREDSYDRYLDHVLAACEGWVAAGRRIRMLCSDIEMDPPVARTLVERLSPAAQARTEIVDVDTVDGFLRSVAGARFVVASRLHALIMALAMEAPVIALSPARKVTRMMADADLTSYCIEMPTMSLDELTGVADRIEDEQAELRQKIASTTRGYREHMTAAYDDLVGLLGPSVRRSGTGS